LLSESCFVRSPQLSSEPEDGHAQEDPAKTIAIDRYRTSADPPRDAAVDTVATRILEAAAIILRQEREAEVCSILIDMKLIAMSYFARPRVEQTATLGSRAGSTVQEHRVRATPRDGEADRHLSRGRACL